MVFAFLFSRFHFECWICGRLLGSGQSEQVLSEDLSAEIVEEQLQFASNISIFFAAVFFMFLAFYIIFSMNETSMRVVLGRR